jgi:hypothetical protein
MDTIEELMAEPRILSTRPALTELAVTSTITKQHSHLTHHVSASTTGTSTTPVPQQSAITAPGAPGVHTPNEDGSDESSGKQFAFGAIIPNQDVSQSHVQILRNGKMTPPLVSEHDDVGILSGQLAMTSMNAPVRAWAR